MPAIDTQRFLQDLDTLREIGRYRTGVHRPTFSPPDMESRRWLCDRMTEVGLEPTIDGIGNVLGRHPGTGPHLLGGRPIETQHQAGGRARRGAGGRGRPRARPGRPAGGCVRL